MRVLVAGGAGFIGSHLVDSLLDSGYSVTVMDNHSTGRWSFSNRKDELVTGQLSVWDWDITNRMDETVRKILGPFDQIYNLACPASPVHYQADPIQTWRTSVFGAHNLLECAEEWGSRILQASTSEIYGDPLAHPQSERYWGNVNPIGPRSCYDEGKRAAETIFYDYGRHRGVDIRVARIFNTYGPRMAPDDGRVVSNFIVQALRGEQLTVYGNGMQTRSFCYVDDLVRGLRALMEHGHAANVPMSPVNLGNPDEFTIMELATMISQKISGRGVVLRPLPQDDPQRRKPDIGRAQVILGWEPRVPLDEGLGHLISYFKETL